jgi:hypothetical protein
MENSQEYTPEKLSQIQANLEKIHSELVSNRINKVYQIHEFYLKNKFFPKSTSTDPHEKTLGHMLNKMNNPENAKFLEKEIKLMHSLEWK